MGICLQKESTIPMYSSMMVLAFSHWYGHHLKNVFASVPFDASSARLRDLQLSIHLSVVLDWSTNYIYACKSKLSVQDFKRYIRIQLLFITEHVLSVCVSHQLRIAKACAPSQGSCD